MASTTQSLDQKNAERFDPFIFWGINICWVTLLLGFIFWLWKCNGAQALIGWTNFNSSNTNSHQRSEESQDDDSPEGKREKLMEYFRQRKVQMVVGEKDILCDNTTLLRKPRDSSKQIFYNSRMLSSSSRRESFAGEMNIKAHEIDNSEPLNTQSNECTGITLLLCEIPNNESREESEDLTIEGIDVESPDQHVKVQKELGSNKKLYSTDNSNDVKLHEITPGGIDAESSHEVTDAQESIEKKQENINYEDLKTANFTLDDDLMGASLRSVSTIDQGVLIIPTEIGERHVPNCCAICLASYEFEDSVVWSTNTECIHAFHEDCVMDWLIKMYETYPCPCCRSPFVEIHTRKKKEKQILWEPGHAMNLNIISF